MYKKIISLICILFLTTVCLVFSQEKFQTEETASTTTLSTPTISVEKKKQIILQIREEVYGTSVTSSKLAVVPLIQDHSAISTLVAKNIFDGLEEKNTSKEVEIFYNVGVEKNIDKFNNIIDEISADEKFNIIIMIYVTSETVASRKQDNVYGVEVNVYDDGKNLMYSFAFEDTLGNFFSEKNTDRYQVEKLASLVQDYWDNKDYSILQIKSLVGPLPEYRIELDGETLETVSATSGYAYFLAGNHEIKIYHIVPPEKEGGKSKKYLKLSLKTTDDNEEYIQEIDFSPPKPKKQVKVSLIETPFSIDLLAGADIPFIFEKKEDILSYNIFINTQFRYSFNKILKFPVYVGIMLKYNILDNLDQQLYKATNYDTPLNSSAEGIRTMIGLFPEAGVTYQLNNFMVLYAGLTGGYLIYSPSSTDTTPYSLPITMGTTVPAFGVNFSISEHINSKFYIIEQITLLYTDYRWVHNYIYAIPEDKTIPLLHKSESTKSLATLISSISVGIGYRF